MAFRGKQTRCEKLRVWIHNPFFQQEMDVVRLWFWKRWKPGFCFPEELGPKNSQLDTKKFRKNITTLGFSKKFLAWIRPGFLCLKKQNQNPRFAVPKTRDESFASSFGESLGENWNRKGRDDPRARNNPQKVWCGERRSCGKPCLKILSYEPRSICKLVKLRKMQPRILVWSWRKSLQLHVCFLFQTCNAMGLPSQVVLKRE